MSVLDKNRAAAEAEAADVADRRLRCSCLPFCFWRGSSRSRRTEPRGAEAGKRHRRQFRLTRLSWLAFSWPWRRKGGNNKKDAGGGGYTKTTGKQQRRGRRRLLLLLKTSLQAKKALASVVVSGDSGGLLVPATVSSFGDAKKQQIRSKPRPTADGAAPSGTRSQPQASTTAMGTGGGTAPARLGTNRPCTTTTDEPAMAAGAHIWRAPLRRHSLRQPDRPAGASGLWTAATTLGVIVLLGRVTAVVFLCSCLYGARFVRKRAGGVGASAKSSGGAGASSSRRSGDPIVVAAEKVVAELCVTEECKKKVVMAGLLERAGKRPSSRFGR